MPSIVRPRMSKATSAPTMTHRRNRGGREPWLRFLATLQKCAASCCGISHRKL
jgi:hypothetical protein